MDMSVSKMHSGFSGLLQKQWLSDVWRADEMYVKIKGNAKWLFALMDDETRFWIAKEVANTKHDHDTKPLFRMGKEVAEKKPRVLIAFN